MKRMIIIAIALIAAISGISAYAFIGDALSGAADAAGSVASSVAQAPRRLFNRDGRFVNRDGRPENKVYNDQRSAFNNQQMPNRHRGMGNMKPMTNMQHSSPAFGDKTAPMVQGASHPRISEGNRFGGGRSAGFGRVAQ